MKPQHTQPDPHPHPYTRYVAIGDSQTEGIGDGDEVNGYRGWADRLAELLAAANPGLTYANLAVRGRLAAQVKEGQLAPALALKPDVATVVAGMNDLIRPGADPARIAADVEEMCAELAASGARVATVTYPDLGLIAPAARRLVPRVVDFNARIRDMAERHGIALVDTFPHVSTTDARVWSSDRLHASPYGHALIASAMADALGLPGHADWAKPLPPLAPVPTWRAGVTEVRWVAGFMGPWIWRRIRGRSSGDGRSAKRPELGPVTPVGPGA
ncbi:SGNH/GDSL hydrolase family protein [Streptomyces sp. NBC_01304]|uniref:SGNH/GDSL hydrolase family protein n=1 Tax=Streptomyces sp. NBC_01304 TaxID=2903818 RepID=UPI002E0EBDB8|nr:SGNH/GDSL hydrolase family protein [Streptomyces sp. NBC_01304]